MDNYKMKNEFVATNPCKPIDYSTLVMGGKDTFIKPQDPALISGADALRALADGKSVEWEDENGVWWSVGAAWTWNQLLNMSGIKSLRIKPQTIKLELELPKPFEPKDGDECFIFDSEQEDGFYRFTYGENSGFHKNLIQFGAYRTESEVKQVVEQLRKIRGAS